MYKTTKKMNFNIWDWIFPATPGHLLITGSIIGIVIIVIRKIRKKIKEKQSSMTPKMQQADLVQSKY